MYKLQNDIATGITNMILQTSTGFFIPLIEDNRDYQEYLKWLAEGNEPLPADE
jgi:hypothetical protein